MIIAAVATFCLALLILAFLLPRRSRRPERGGAALVAAPTRATRKAPGALGRWLSKPFHTSQKAIHGSARTGRKGRAKLPF